MTGLPGSLAAAVATASAWAPGAVTVTGLPGGGWQAEVNAWPVLTAVFESADPLVLATAVSGIGGALRYAAALCTCRELDTQHRMDLKVHRCARPGCGCQVFTPMYPPRGDRDGKSQ